MELEAMKKLIKRHQRAHRKLVRDSLQAEQYYRKKNDILKRGAKSLSSADNPLHSADNRIPSNFYNILVNQKAAYLFTVPPIFNIGNTESNEAVQKCLGDDFAKICKNCALTHLTVLWLGCITG